MNVEDLKWVQVSKIKYMEQGRAEGRAIVLEENRMKGYLWAAKAFIEKGFPPEQIADILQLPLETVKNL